jgi:hypothetical protein
MIACSDFHLERDLPLNDQQNSRSTSMRNVGQLPATGIVAPATGSADTMHDMSKPCAIPRGTHNLASSCL